MSILSCGGTGFNPGARLGAEIGADGFPIHVTEVKIAPESMTAEHRRQFKGFVKSKGRVICALCHIDETRLASVGKAGGNTRRFPSVYGMLADREVEAVSVCVPQRPAPPPSQRLWITDEASRGH
jgi:hypothetical protein